MRLKGHGLIVLGIFYPGETMKKWILLFVVVISLFGCADDPTLDGVVSKDAQGNVFLIEHHFGNTYTVKKIPVETQIK